jgi:hypothetical protein
MLQGHEPDSVNSEPLPVTRIAFRHLGKGRMVDGVLLQ